MTRINANGLVLVLLLSSCARYGYQEGDEIKTLSPADSGPRETGSLDQKAAEGRELGLDSAVDRDAPQMELGVDDLGSDDVPWPADSTLADQPVAHDLPPDRSLPHDASPVVDQAWPDMQLPDLPVVRPDAAQDADQSQLPACPAKMATFSDYCIDNNEGTLQSWVKAAEDCMSQGKRLCTLDEWTTACNSSDPGLVDMTGNGEWINKLFSDTEAKKAGEINCGSLSHDVVDSGSFGTRCCLTRISDPSGMFLISATGTRINQNQGAAQTWVRAANDCMSQGKRLCHQLEWTPACNAGPPSVNDMVGDYEWLMTIKSTTDAYKAGSSSCTDISNHNFLLGAYRTRCCF